MNEMVRPGQVPGTWNIVVAAVVGAVGGLLGTAAALGSPEFGILGAIGGAVASMIATLARFENAEV